MYLHSPFELVDRLRVQQDISTQELCNRLGITVTTWYELKRNRKLSIEHFLIASEFLYPAISDAELEALNQYHARYIFTQRLTKALMKIDPTLTSDIVLLTATFCFFSKKLSAKLIEQYHRSLCYRLYEHVPLLPSVYRNVIMASRNGS